MTKAELIAKLAEYPDDAEVVIKVIGNGETLTYADGFDVEQKDGEIILTDW